VLVLCLLCWGVMVALPAPGVRAEDRPFRQDILLGTTYLYNRDFARAEALFLKTIAQDPDHPSGYFYLAMVSWSELAAGFWTPEVLDRFEARIEQAVDAASRRVERNPSDAGAYFYLGGSLGFKGRLLLMQQSYFSAFTAAVRAVEALEACLKLDPDNRDVLFGLGTFEYYTAKLSGILRFLSWFLIHPPDRREGLRKLHLAAAEGTATRFEARSQLLHIYLFLEDDPARALPIAEGLSRRFPGNPRFAYLLGVTRMRGGGGIKSVVDLLKQRRNETPSPQDKLAWDNTRLYLLAGRALYESRMADARGLLKTVLARVDPARDPFMAAFPTLKVGMSHDLQGDREIALELYERVRSMKNGAGGQFLAEKYMERPIRPSDPFLSY
jgi:tetratricopeptide (TPR) repeat protein